MVNHQLQVRCRPGKVHRSETDVLPLSCVCMCVLSDRLMMNSTCPQSVCMCVLSDRLMMNSTCPQSTRLCVLRYCSLFFSSHLQWMLLISRSARSILHCKTCSFLLHSFLYHVVNPSRIEFISFAIYSHWWQCENKASSGVCLSTW